jgi:hypothetical protein
VLLDAPSFRSLIVYLKMLSMVGASAAFATVASVAPVATRACAPQIGFGKAELQGGKPASRTQAFWRMRP